MVGNGGGLRNFCQHGRSPSIRASCDSWAHRTPEFRASGSQFTSDDVVIRAQLTMRDRGMGHAGARIEIILGSPESAT